MYDTHRLVEVLQHLYSLLKEMETVSAQTSVHRKENKLSDNSNLVKTYSLNIRHHDKIKNNNRNRMHYVDNLMFALTIDSLSLRILADATRSSVVAEGEQIAYNFSRYHSAISILKRLNPLGFF